MDAAARRAALDRLEVLVGEWELEISLPTPPGAPPVRSRFEWALDRQYLIQRTEIPTVPEAPDSLILYDVDRAGDGHDFTQHYFDSRGVTRLYAMRVEDCVWTLHRNREDFSELSFDQRWRATVAPDRIEGHWDIRHPGGDWEPDFGLIYRRVDR